MAKLDPEGTTIWGKAFSLQTQTYNVHFSNIYIHNDTIWSLMNTESRGFYHGFILMYDANGKLIKSISIVTSTNNVEQLGLLQVTSIFTFDQDSLIIGGVVAQTMSSIGYSVDSFYDEGVFKFDSQGNFIWGTAIDYDMYYDSD